MAVPPARPRCRTYDFPSASGGFGLNLPWGHTPSVFEHGRGKFPLCTKTSQTFPGTLLNLTWLCTKASWSLLRNFLRNPVEPLPALQSLPDLPRNLLEPCPEPCLTWRGSTQKPLRPSPEPSEPSPEPRWTWPGAWTSAHRSYSGLKTPLAYAVGEKLSCSCFSHFALTVLCIIVSLKKH